MHSTLKLSTMYEGKNGNLDKQHTHKKTCRIVKGYEAQQTHGCPAMRNGGLKSHSLYVSSEIIVSDVFILWPPVTQCLNRDPLSSWQWSMW